MKSFSCVRQSFGLALVLATITLASHASTASAQFASDVSQYDSSDYQGVIGLSGHSTYFWYLQINPQNSFTGEVWLWVNGSPISGTYYNFGSYRWVQLDLYGAAFLYRLDLSQLNSRGPIVDIQYFTDSYGNWITPGLNILWEAI